MKLKCFLLFTVIIFITGCEQEHAPPPVAIKFQLINENGHPSNIFQEGENFSFKLSVRNLTPSLIEYNTSYVDDDFFRVFQWKNNEGWIDKGKPYQNMFCLYILDFGIAPNNERVYEIPWIPEKDFCCYPFCKVNDNPYLAKGKYKTFINGPFEFKVDGEAIVIKKNLTIFFEVK